MIHFNAPICRQIFTNANFFHSHRVLCNFCSYCKRKLWPTRLLYMLYIFFLFCFAEVPKFFSIFNLSFTYRSKWNHELCHLHLRRTQNTTQLHWQQLFYHNPNLCYSLQPTIFVMLDPFPMQLQQSLQ